MPSDTLEQLDQPTEEMAKRHPAQLSDDSQSASLEDQVRALQIQLANDEEITRIAALYAETTELLRKSKDRNDELSREVTRLQTILEARDGEPQRGTKRTHTDGGDENSPSNNVPKRALHQSLGDLPVDPILGEACNDSTNSSSHRYGDVESSRASVNENVQPIALLASGNGESVSSTAPSPCLLSEPTDTEWAESGIEDTTPIWHFGDCDELGVSPVEFAIGEKIEVEGHIQATTTTEKGAFRWIAPLTKPRLLLYVRNQAKTKYIRFKVLSVAGLQDILRVQQIDNIVAVEAMISGRFVCTLIRDFRETIILNASNPRTFAIRLTHAGFALQNDSEVAIFRYSASPFDIEPIWSTSEANHNVTYGSFSLSPHGQLCYLASDNRRKTGDVYMFEVEQQGEPTKIERTGNGRFIDGASSSDLAIISRGRLKTFKRGIDGTLRDQRIIVLKSFRGRATDPNETLDYATVKWEGDSSIHGLTKDRLKWIHVTLATETVGEKTFDSPVSCVDVPEGGGGIEVVFQDGITRFFDIPWIPRHDPL